MNKFIFYNYLPLLADHIIDCKYKNRIVHHNYPIFNINNVKKYDKIFVKTDLLPIFFNKFLPKIKNCFFLITGVSDKEIDNKYLKFLNKKKIIGWLGHNISINHEKIFKIPIGFEENELNGGNQKLLEKLYKNNILFENKNNKLLITSLGNTHKSRNKIKSIFINKDFCLYLDKKLPFELYMNEINKYKFVLSPRGNGIDTHRFWEILLMGSIPIVESSGLNCLYKNFPCIIVNSFKDINNEILDNYQYENNKKDNISKYLLINNLNEIINNFIKQIKFINNI